MSFEQQFALRQTSGMHQISAGTSSFGTNRTNQAGLLMSAIRSAGSYGQTVKMTRMPPTRKPSTSSQWLLYASLIKQSCDTENKSCVKSVGTGALKPASLNESADHHPSAAADFYNKICYNKICQKKKSASPIPSPPLARRTEEIALFSQATRAFGDSLPCGLGGQKKRPLLA